jgi:hypothetical protein
MRISLVRILAKWRKPIWERDQVILGFLAAKIILWLRGLLLAAEAGLAG